MGGGEHLNGPEVQMFWPGRMYVATPRHASSKMTSAHMKVIVVSSPSYGKSVSRRTVLATTVLEGEVVAGADGEDGRHHEGDEGGSRSRKTHLHNEKSVCNSLEERRTNTP